MVKCVGPTRCLMRPWAQSARLCMRRCSHAVCVCVCVCARVCVCVCACACVLDFSQLDGSIRRRRVDASKPPHHHKESDSAFNSQSSNRSSSCGSSTDSLPQSQQHTQQQQQRQRAVAARRARTPNSLRQSAALSLFIIRHCYHSGRFLPPSFLWYSSSRSRSCSFQEGGQVR